MYNPDNQYRCIIIRGKAQNQMDDLLPFYANVVARLCPNDKNSFKKKFRDELSQYFFNLNYSNLNESKKKTVDNHRTEMAGQLLRLYYEVDGYIEMSESCKLIIKTGDQPAFFKNLCLNFQFPNAMQRLDKVLDLLENNIKIKSLHFVVTLLDYANERQVVFTKQEIAYYVLNSLDVLQGNVSYKEVYEIIIADRHANIEKPQLRGSNAMQHITEQIKLLELANIIRQDKGYLYLNTNERLVINQFKKELTTPYFNMYTYYNNGVIDDAVKNDWAKYYGAVRTNYDVIKTTQESLGEIVLKEANTTKPQVEAKQSTVEIGDKGELYVFEMEKKRIRRYKERHLNKVLLLGKIRGLGYDISSIEAEGEKPEYTRYIEVKSSIRVTEPILNETWRDPIALTAKEWMAAEQYNKHYNIYRVYFTPNKTIVYRIKDPYAMYTNGELDVYPTMYHMDIRKSNIKVVY